MKKKIGSILLEKGSATASQLEEALIEQKESCKVLGEILMRKGTLNEQQLTEALGVQWDMPVVIIDERSIGSLAINALPIELMTRLNVLPLEIRRDGSLLIAASEPQPPSAIEELQAAANLKIEFALTTEKAIYSALKNAKRPEFSPSKNEPDAIPLQQTMNFDAEETAPKNESKFQKNDQPFHEKPPHLNASTGNPQPSFSPAPKLGYLLLKDGLIDEKQLQGALQKQRSTGKRIGDIFVDEGLITEIKLAETLSEQLKLPLITMTRYQPMQEAIQSVPRSVAERLKLVPLSFIDNNKLLVAMADPLDILAQDEVRTITGLDLELRVTTLTEIKNNLSRLYNLPVNIEDAVVELRDAQLRPDYFAEAQDDDAPVIQMVSNILNQATREDASDIHIEPCLNNARVRYRVDGVLYTAFEFPSSLHPSVTARVKIMSGIDIAEKRKPQDGRILIKTEGRSVDLRVSSVPSVRGEKIVLRILDHEKSPIGLDRLELEADDMEKIKFFCRIPWGILLATGPTGSGKSTTLYSMLDRMNQTGVSIVTIEDPVEYRLDGICQIHVNEKAGLTFESALRSILRQDPDKIMVGEIRDMQTAQVAIRAALTGHFVLSTLHTNDAPSALTRLVDMGVPPFLVANSLTGIIAQRLLRKLCPYCKQEYTLDPNTCSDLDLPRGSSVWKAVGCNECRQGYKGRRAIFEIMTMDDDIIKMILRGAESIHLRDVAIEKGMKTLRRAAINCALAGITSLEEVFSITI